MPIDIVVANNPLSQLKQIKQSRIQPDYTMHDLGIEPDTNPAYIVEISFAGKQLQLAHPMKIVTL